MGLKDTPIVWRFLLALSAILCASQSIFAHDEAELLFVRRIEPLFSEKCLACHGNDESDLQGGLDMRSLAAMLKGGDHETPVIVPFKPEQSPIYQAMLRTHDEWQPMPPKEADQLYAQQIEWVNQWIEAGAPWPDEDQAKSIAIAHADQWSAEDGVVVKTIGALSPQWANRRYKPDGLWGYQPVRKPVIPNSSNEHPIDALIASHMPQGLSTAPIADARTFLRRATFDLTGLPPTPEEMDSFEKHYARDADAAVQSTVDRLLASPHYGERMAQHWLDVTRYADSSGFANDFERATAWRYRDYVIRAFNDDKPYDQFVNEQIAGDEIDSENPEMIIATGFLRMGPWELTGMEVAKVARQRFLDDVTNSVGETFLAHSLQCARCHDHKFDPIPTHDYYAVQAVFATMQLCDREAPYLDDENTGGFEERQYLERIAAEHSATLAELDQVLLENARRWFEENGKDAAKWNQAVEDARKFAFGTSPSQHTNRKRPKTKSFSDVFSNARNRLAAGGVAEIEYPPKLVGFTPEQFGRDRVARKGLERLQWEFDRYKPFALAVYNGRTPKVTTVSAPVRMPADRMTRGELERSFIRIGGDPFAEGPQVMPGVLSVLDSIERPTIPNSIEGRRKAFAQWVASKENPLTTRTIVNRIWLWHFGEPLAGNPNNFGSTGKKPTHPELLDWLAATFVEQDWSIKALHRSIMTSDAYGRSAFHPDLQLVREKDPLGTSYAVFKPRRLSAEELRDAMLAATGELNPTLGGISNRPEINSEAALQPRQVMGTFAAAWTANPQPHQRNRRSIYALKLRGLSDPSMEVFNSPVPDFSCERRDASTVTPQVFAMFNSRATQSRSLALAARVTRETNTDRDAITRCFELALGRDPKPDEWATCLDHWRDIESMLDDRPPERFMPPLEVRRDAVEENTGEKFSFREKLHAHNDFVPDLQPADVPKHTRALADVCLALFNTNEFAYVY
jgi:hypothetical protein